MHKLCPYPGICKDEVFLPDSLCFKCFHCDFLLTNLPQPCLWSVHTATSPPFPLETHPNYPTNRWNFIQVVLDTEINSELAYFVCATVMYGVVALLLVLVAVMWGFEIDETKICR